MATVREMHGRIDALVLNAGLSVPATLRDETLEHFRPALRRQCPWDRPRGAGGSGRHGAGRSVVLVGSIADVMG